MNVITRFLMILLAPVWLIGLASAAAQEQLPLPPRSGESRLPARPRTELQFAPRPDPIPGDYKRTPPRRRPPARDHLNPIIAPQFVLPPELPFQSFPEGLGRSTATITNVDRGPAYEVETLLTPAVPLATQPTDELPPLANRFSTIQFDQAGNGLLVESMAEHIQLTDKVESHKIEQIRHGLEQLEATNRSIREQALVEQQQHQAESKRALRAEREAAAAREAAVAAQNIAEQTMHQLLLIQKQLRSQPSVTQSPSLTSTEVATDATDAIDTIDTNGSQKPPDSSTSPVPVGADAWTTPPAVEPSVSNSRPMRDESEPPPSPSIVPVTDNVIDREGLADSLFGAGHFQRAAEIYQSLLANPPAEADVTWFHFQLASCLRHLRNIPAAQKHYRIVAGNANDEFLARTARWWLSNMEESLSLENQLNQWQQNLSRLEQP